MTMTIDGTGGNGTGRVVQHAQVGHDGHNGQTGHDAKAHELPAYKTLLQNAQAWAAGK